MTIKLPSHALAAPVFDPGALLTTEEVAAVLGVAPQTLTTWRYNRKGPRFVKLPRRIRYRGQDLNRWLHENTVETTSH